eukprot:snap_masked-scaffold_7-processed-gene-16.11-mRNA-1 protein AED:1.00 eAED:1.00 QI:0/-1/0/0/-1/1/1/0/716
MTTEREEWDYLSDLSQSKDGENWEGQWSETSFCPVDKDQLHEERKQIQSNFEKSFPSKSEAPSEVETLRSETHSNHASDFETIMSKETSTKHEESIEVKKEFPIEEKQKLDGVNDLIEKVENVLDIQSEKSSKIDLSVSGEDFSELLVKVETLVRNIFENLFNDQEDSDQRKKVFKCFKYFTASCDDGEDMSILFLEKIWKNHDVFSMLRKLLADEKVVESLQHFISSESIRNLVCDICRNEVDVENLAEFKKTFEVHIGYIMPDFGKLLQKNPSLLSILPKLFNYVNTIFNKQNGPENSTRVIHTGVSCYGCSQSIERKLKAHRSGALVGDEISGIRYKSSIVSDVDFCEACEASEEFDEEFAPFLKIRTPKKAPRQIIVSFDSPKKVECGVQTNIKRVSKSKDLVCPAGHNYKMFSTPHSNLSCDGCDRRIQRGANIVGCRKCNYDLCLKCSKGFLSISRLTKCPQKHSLKSFYTKKSSFQCDECSKKLRLHQLAFGCRQCDYDMCSLCLHKSLSFCKKKQKFVCHGVQGIPLLARKVASLSLHEESDPLGSFVCDLCKQTSRIEEQVLGSRRTPTDLCQKCQHLKVEAGIQQSNLSEPLGMKTCERVCSIVVHRNAEFIARWDVFNSTLKRSWPIGITLKKIISGEMNDFEFRSGHRNKELAVVPLPPGAHGKIKMYFRAPSVAGEFRSFFRLADPQGNIFGEKLELHVRVVQ